MQTKTIATNLRNNFRQVVLFLSFFIYVGCSDVNPQISALHPLNDFDFTKKFIVTANLNSVPLQAVCSRFIEHIDISFDGGSTWMNTTDYNSSSQPNCASNPYMVTLSKSKPPWSTAVFTNGQIINVKFRALSKTGSYAYRDISIKYTPSIPNSQETLVGAGTLSAAGMLLKSRLRAQEQHIAIGGNLIIRGRILE